METTHKKDRSNDPGDTVGHIQSIPGPTPYNQTGEENAVRGGPNEKDAAGEQDQSEEHEDGNSPSEDAQR